MRPADDSALRATSTANRRPGSSAGSAKDAVDLGSEIRWHLVVRMIAAVRVVAGSQNGSDIGLSLGGNQPEDLIMNGQEIFTRSF
jgi:hypothetical protein